MAHRECPQALRGQASIAIGSAEAPRPRPHVTTAKRRFEHIVDVPYDRRGAGRMMGRRVTRKLTQQQRLSESQRACVGDTRIEVPPGMPGVGIGMDLQHVDTQLRIIPRPDIVQAGAADRRERRRARMNERAQARDQPRQRLERERTRDA